VAHAHLPDRSAGLDRAHDPLAQIPGLAGRPGLLQRSHLENSGTKNCGLRRETILIKVSAGEKTSVSNRRATGSKPRRFNVMIASARPLTAASKTSSSPGSRS
jgi:hypothetical protein